MRFLLALTVVTVAALATVSFGRSAAWIVSCQLDHQAMDDPIVFFGQPGASHLHEFVGARGINAFSTAASMRASGTTCGVPGDTSGYWTPDVNRYALGTTRNVLVYYRRMAVSGLTVRPFPFGLKMIVGSAHAMSPSENPGIASGHIQWRCGTGGGNFFSQPTPTCSQGTEVVRIDFPNCWDGLHLDSADHISHMSYDAKCAHGVIVPALREFVRYSVGPGAIDFSLSSGPWFTYHADFLDAWDPATLQGLVSRCMNPSERNCGENPR